jgi:integrase
MSVFKKGNNHGVGYSLNGRWKRVMIGPSKRVAELAEKKIKLKIAKGQFLGIDEPAMITINELSKEYLTYSKANKTADSYRRDQTSIDNLLNAFQGRLISKISAHDLELYKNMRRSQVEPATVNRELSCIKHMFRKAVDWEYLKDNPLKCVRRFKEPPGRVRYLTMDEIDKLLKACAKHLKPIVIFALNTGMRKGEILRLRWSDIDMINRMIKITVSKNNELRYMPINDTLYSLLKKLQNGRKNDGNVFVWKNGKPILRINNGFYNAMERAGITDFRFHDLRHTFASHLAMNGVDIRVIQQLLGHKTISMTMRYSHLSNKNLRQAVDRLDKVGYNGIKDRTFTALLESAK